MNRVLALPIAMIVVLLGACATTRSSAVDDVEGVVGEWRGWLLTTRDFVPATLRIHGDGTFHLDARRIHVSGLLSVKEGQLRFEAGRGWRGAVTLHETPGGQLLKTERDDRLLIGRFTTRSVKG
jgi:hypothetical protein